MSADIVNLRLARKRKTRQAAEAAAANNRVAFGLSRLERLAASHAQDSASRRLDGHKLTEPASLPPKPADG